MKRYSEELKRNALLMAAQPGITVARAERELGITPGLIYKWRRRYSVDMDTLTLQPSEEYALKEKRRRLEKELAELEREVAILKAAHEYFGIPLPKELSDS